MSGAGSDATPLAIDEDIAKITRDIDAMGHWALETVRLALRAMEAADPVAARLVLGRDDRLDTYDVEIEQEAIRILARRQPAAHDVRLLGASIKLITYVDRIGRLGRDIAFYVVDAPSAPLVPPWPLLKSMGEHALAMVELALEAYVQRDLAKAIRVFDSDDAVDELNRRVLQECVQVLHGNPPEPRELFTYVLVSRHLERVADNACKVAEKTIYMETGKRRREFLTADKKVVL
ncbi:MAG TPA: phosphate signaling complex protein PhoU [Thermoplasmata archaeon]|nr:phosphate signaling complex protein PhoU [Thermoplasmata archaeon]